MTTREPPLDERSTDDEVLVEQSTWSRQRIRVLWAIVSILSVLVIAAIVVLIAWYQGLF